MNKHSSKMQSAFWDFTVRAYAVEGVPRACLNLQDVFGMDINFLMLCLYAGANGTCLDNEHFARAEIVAGPWRSHVIHPLRKVRRFLKEQPKSPALEELRSGILSQEIASEEVQQRMMEEVVDVPAGQPDARATARNLVRYCASIGVAPMAAEAGAALAFICHAVHPDLDAAQALPQLERAMSDEQRATDCGQGTAS